MSEKSEKLEINRRNILTVLGVAAVGTPAIATEQADSWIGHGMSSAPAIALRKPETQKRFARILAEAAAAVQRGDLNCVGMEVNSELKLDEWMEHKVTFTFELTRSDEPSA